MVLIMSGGYDYSTIEITQWLKYMKVPFIRIDGEETYKIRKVNIGDNNDFVIYNDLGKEIWLSQIRSIWYRRGKLNIVYDLSNEVPKELIRYIKEHLSDELKILEDYFYFLMEKIPHIGTYETRGMNKLEVLYKAQKIGLNIPNTCIVDSIDSLGFNTNTITKCISEPFMPLTSFGRYMMYTEQIEYSDIPNRFFPSLFQEKYEKEADLRIFYLNNSFYGMAICSQSHTQTSTDFRKYLSNNPNRSFPFNISKDIQQKLTVLMGEVGLETGSIDMIFTRDGNYIFLEINPVGQFGMTSYPCNYYIEKAIANHLKNLAYNERENTN